MNINILVFSTNTWATYPYSTRLFTLPLKQPLECPNVDTKDTLNFCCVMLLIGYYSVLFIICQNNGVKNLYDRRHCRSVFLDDSSCWIWHMINLMDYTGRRLLPLMWRHNKHDGVLNHQPHDCLLNRLLRCRSKKISKLCVTAFYEGNSPVTGEFPAQRASNEENISIWWRHHGSCFAMSMMKQQIQYQFPNFRPI